MAKYVQSHLDWSVSENDFTEWIVQRLSAAHEEEPFVDPAAPALADEAVKELLRFLVYEEKRSIYRKSLIPLEENTPDPQSALFFSELETESRAKEILSHVPKNFLPVVKSLYGLYGEEELSARAIARKLGIKEDSLRQKLCRLRADLRQKLERTPNVADVDFSDDELRELHKTLQSAALKAYPNPERKGCPGTEVLDEIAETSVPSKHPLYEHVATCSPCLKEMLGIRGQKIRARKARSRKQLRFVMGLAAAAAILGLAAFLLRDTRPSISQQQNAQVAPNGDDIQNKQLLTGVLDYRNLTAQRGPGELGVPPQVLSKLIRKLIIMLPVKSQAGNYEVEIRKASDSDLSGKWRA